MRGHLVVIGGGVTGLTAGWEAQRLGWAVTIVEASDRFGGKLKSSEFLGHRIDEGADAFLRRVPDALELCSQLGLDDLVSPSATAASIWVDGQMKALPGGLVLGAPARFDDLAASGILSAAGLARARCDADRHGPGIDHDMAAGAVIRQRYGDEVADRLVGPLLGGINAGDPDQLSIDAAVPQLAVAARADASMSRALASLPAPSGEPIFAAPTASMAAIPERLVEALTAGGATLVTNRSAGSLERRGSLWTIELDGTGLDGTGLDGTELDGTGLENDRAIEADAVVIAVPAFASARLIGELSPSAAAILAGIDHSSVALVTLGYHADALAGPLDGSGFLVPRHAGLTLTAVSWASSKWPHWTDGSHVILRVSAGHRLDARPLDFDDADLIEALRRDLDLTMGLDADPVATRISRWVDGFPQYDVGHLDRMARLDAAVSRDLPGVVVTGAAHRGLGVPACIGQGRAAARRLDQRRAA